MGYDYDQTHEKIMESARIHFMKNGFLNASIRQICKDAGVTNGAFYAHFESKEELFSKIVSPCIKEMQNLYSGESLNYMDIKSAKDVKKAIDRTFSSNSLLIRYIFENSDTFRLILTAGSGTEYENFVEKLAKDEAVNTMKFLKKCKPYLKDNAKISEGLIQRISYFTVSSVFDGLLKGKTEKEVLKDAELSSQFCVAGLKSLLNV